MNGPLQDSHRGRLPSQRTPLWEASHYSKEGDLHLNVKGYMNIPKLLKYTLLVQGLFYCLTSLLSFASLDAFFALVQNSSDPFKTHSNAALFLSLGLFFIYGSWKEQHQKLTASLTAITALLITIVDLYYLSHNSTSWPFWFDAAEEFTVFILCCVGLLSSRNQAP
jgi:hypothetical protein